MNVRHGLATNLRRLRLESGLSQEDFANTHEFDRTYISGIERGVRNPTIAVVKRLSKALKVDILDLFAKPGKYVSRNETDIPRRESGASFT